MIVSFQNQYYTFTVTLKNGVNEITLGTAAIEELIISENIFQWYSSGHIIIDNTYLNFFRYSDDNPREQIPVQNKFYKFRSDGRDTIHITIKPEKDQNSANMIKDEKWILELEAVVYDIEELTGESNENKSIKLYFHDKTFQMMTEKNAEFSTAKKGLELSGKTAYDANNNERSLRTGQAIEELLKSTGFEKHCKLIEPGTTNEFWDMGDKKNTVFYSSPSNSRVIQDLQYLLDIHCGDESTGYDPCLFKLERNEEMGKARQFTLKPLTSYFKKAGNSVDFPKEYQIELFTIKSLSDEKPDETKQKTFRVPIVPNMELKQNFYSFDYSTIETYQFMDFSPIDATKNLTNYFLVNYNATNRQFNIQKDTIEDAENHIKEKYLVEVMSPDKALFMPKNNYMTSGDNTTVRYTLNFTESARKSEGRNKTILTTLFKNMAIGFTVMGATIRQPGRFIGVLQGKSQNDQDYDNRLEGQFFLTQVNHIFSPKSMKYMNELVGVKMHMFNNEKLAIPYTDDLHTMQ